MRLTFVDWAADEHRVVWTFHHALLDGRSFPLVLREVFAFYDAAVTGDGRSICRCRARTASTSSSSAASTSRAAEDVLARRSSRDSPRPTPLVIDRSHAGDEARPVRDSGRLGAAALARDDERAARVRRCRRASRSTRCCRAPGPSLLHRYSGETDIVFGATRACRRSAFPDADDMVGLFINTLPLRVHVDPGRSTRRPAADVRALQIELREYEHTPLAKVQGWSEVPRGRALFDTILVYENRTLDATLRATSTPMGVDSASRITARRTIRSRSSPMATTRCCIRLENDRRRVDDARRRANARASRERSSRRCRTTADRSCTPCRFLRMRSGRRLRRWPCRCLVVSADCLHERSEERARVRRSGWRWSCDGESLSYGELERRANALALRGCARWGWSTGRLVGLADRALARARCRDPRDPEGGRRLFAARSCLPEGARRVHARDSQRRAWW